jgi:predicted dehydrogenase
MNDKISWGILGTGRIAREFAEALNRLPEARLRAVASRDPAKARRFASRFGVERAYGDYRVLVEDPAVQVVYVATLHSRHAADSALALEAGKAVLCEKPLTVTAAEAETLIALARSRGLFLMEAMWTRCFPLMRRLRELLAAGELGEPRLLRADFGFYADYTAAPRLWDPALGGGALLDVGVYPVALASWVFGAPTVVQSHARLGRNGVDEEVAMLLGYPEGQSALLHAAVRLETEQQALLTGTRGRVWIHRPWWRPTRMTWFRADGTEERLEFPLPADANGYEYEAQEVMACLRVDRLESPLMPWDESLAIMRTLDAVRAGWQRSDQ